MSIDQREEQLIAQALQGNRNAFGDLYEFHLDDVYRYILYRVSSKADAEDLTEQVFLKVWESLHTFRQEAPFKVWLFRFARNTVIDHYRTNKNAEFATDISSTASYELPEDMVRAQEITARLMRSITKLSNLQQDVIILRFANGYNAAETAQILDRDVGTIRVLQHRALKTLQAFMVAEDVVNE